MTFGWATRQHEFYTFRCRDACLGLSEFLPEGRSFRIPASRQVFGSEPRVASGTNLQARPYFVSLATTKAGRLVPASSKPSIFHTWDDLRSAEPLYEAGYPEPSLP